MRLLSHKPKMCQLPRLHLKLSSSCQYLRQAEDLHLNRGLGIMVSRFLARRFSHGTNRRSGISTVALAALKRQRRRKTCPFMVVSENRGDLCRERKEVCQFPWQCPPDKACGAQPRVVPNNGAERSVWLQRSKSHVEAGSGSPCPKANKGAPPSPHAHRIPSPSLGCTRVPLCTVVPPPMALPSSLPRPRRAPPPAGGRGIPGLFSPAHLCSQQVPQ